LPNFLLQFQKTSKNKNLFLFLEVAFKERFQMKLKKQYILFLFCCIFVFNVGCGGAKKPDGMPQLYKTTLLITQEKTPLAGAIVSLVSEDVSNNWTSGGTTNANGVVNIMTYGQFLGCPEGKFKVCISKQMVEGKVDMSDPASPKGSPIIYDLVPPELNSAKTTTLEIEVKAGEKNHFELDAGKSVHIKAAIPDA
jgi:hypothetical protein